MKTDGKEDKETEKGMDFASGQAIEGQTKRQTRKEWGMKSERERDRNQLQTRDWDLAQTHPMQFVWAGSCLFCLLHLLSLWLRHDEIEGVDGGHEVSGRHSNALGAISENERDGHAVINFAALALTVNCNHFTDVSDAKRWEEDRASESSLQSSLVALWLSTNLFTIALIPSVAEYSSERSDGDILQRSET